MEIVDVFMSYDLKFYTPVLKWFVVYFYAREK
jgi:hypothetical protein